ncbi:MAG: 8-oxo-dGTP diphosphatase MutT [Deltaproteobacteria bacterium]|nr:8-oxo-dGTP diphosphatase MutT [Deltaproteobacteria bacterium]
MTVLVVAGVLVEDHRVLLTRRPGGAHLEGYWEFPGGKIEPGEAPEEALARELREEISLDVRVGRVLDVTFWRYPTKDVLLLFYEVTRVAGEVQDLGVAAHAWARLEELPDYQFPPADVRVLARVREMLTGR